MGVTALEFLKNPEKRPISPFTVVFGDEAFLKAEVLKALRASVLSEEDADFSLTRFDGAVVSFVDVLRETSMLPMFGTGKRLVLIEQADSFLAQNKERLETYIDSPGKAGFLVLILTTFPSNLRLYKKADAKGLIIDCRAFSPKMTTSWLIDRAKNVCNVELPRESAELLVELVGDDLGSLDQETRRLALLSPSKRIDVELIKSQASAQRQHKVWDLVDAALDENTSEALRQLDKLIAAGEVPIAILAQMAATLRKLAAASQLYIEMDPTKPQMSMSAILDRVGVKPFFRAKYIEQLKKLGMKRGAVLSTLLLKADADLKGGSRSDPKQILERFIVRVSSPNLRTFDSLR